jgi:hypothetical protein
MNTSIRYSKHTLERHPAIDIYVLKNAWKDLGLRVESKMVFKIPLLKRSMIPEYPTIKKGF